MELNKKNSQSIYYMVFKSLIGAYQYWDLRAMLWLNLSLVDKEVNFKARPTFYK